MNALTSILNKNYDLFIRSLKRVYNNAYLLIFTILYDALFIICYGFIASAMAGKIAEFMASTGYFVVQESIKNAGGEGTISSIVWNSSARGELIMIAVLFILFVLSAYFVYCFFQGLCWRMIKRFSGEKITIKEQLKKFFLVNIFWFVWIVLYNIMDYLALLRKNLLQTESSGFAFYTFMIVLGYFMLISYSLIGKEKSKIIRKSFLLGVKKINVLFSYVIILIIMAALGMLISSSIGNYLISIILQIFIVLPILSWARVYIDLSVAD